MPVEYEVSVVEENGVYQAGAGIGFPGEEGSYLPLTEKPSINGNVLVGDKSTEELGIDHVSFADNLVASSGITSASPYLFRKSPNNVSAELHRLVGGTVAWNQQVIDGALSDATHVTARYCSISVSGGVATFTPTSAGTERGGYFDTDPAIQGHRYLVSMMVMCSTAGQVTVGYNGANVNKVTVSANTWTRAEVIYTPQVTTNNKVSVLQYNSITTSDTVKAKLVNSIDLTALFGSTMADAIATMESTTAGSGVAFFRSLFPSAYYPYSAPTLQSVQTSARVTRGFNQWDEEWEQGSINAETGADVAGTNLIRSKNYIPVVPNTQYFLRTTATSLVYFYDGNKNYLTYDLGGSVLSAYTFTTPPGCMFVRFRTSSVYGGAYLHDICINISDSNRNGQYQSYEAKSYPIDDVVLNGIPKLTNGVLSYDGDIYLPDGSVTRKYSNVVDLGDYVWTKTTISSQTVFYANLTGGKKATPFNGVCTAYPISDTNIALADKTAWLYGGSSFSRIAIRDDAYNGGDATAFRTAMAGKKLVYELATPTTEQADPYAEIQSAGETEQFVSESVVPVGNSAFYPEDLTGVVQNLAPLPTSAGEYKLKVTVSGGVPSYSWVAG